MSHQEYNALIDELDAVARRVESERGMGRGSICLTDPCVNAENVLVDGMSREHPNFWDRMISAENFAGAQAEAAGFDINEAVGRDIY